MKQIVIEGNQELTGTIRVSGAKNSAVALIPAAILSDENVVIENVPNISDISALNEILEYLGAKVVSDGLTMKIDSSNIVNREIPEEISKKLRASYYFMSVLLGKFKKVEMYFPGGCSIGARPIDQTLKGYKALGATVLEEGNKYTIIANDLVGGHVYLDMPSVGATVNTMLVAVKAKGETIIENAAKEPEIVNIAIFLNNMGAKITGAGTSEIIIQGVEKLGKAYIEVIPDRIEAGTYVIAGALMGNNLKIVNIIPDHIEALTLKLKEMGFKMNIGSDFLEISSMPSLKAVRVKTLGYPGFATDLQQPLTVLLTQCNGVSKLDETIYENRFKNVEFLIKLGADIKLIDNQHIEVSGPSDLVGTIVSATDLRAGACLVLAGLKAKGVTVVKEIEHVLRGYENIVEKLSNVGAKIKIEEYD
ncbi:MAG: UDP-N-acetylglucosamine 1-carboxyvinyltransferase [Bacilli bacterium]